MSRTVMTWAHLPEGFITTIMVAGWVSADRRVHAVLVLAAVVVLITGTASIWLEPGSGRELLH